METVSHLSMFYILLFNRKWLPNQKLFLQIVSEFEIDRIFLISANTPYRFKSKTVLICSYLMQVNLWRVFPAINERVRLVAWRYMQRYFSHICDGTYMCRRIEEEVEPTDGLPTL